MTLKLAQTKCALLCVSTVTYNPCTMLIFLYLPAICASPALVFKAHGIGLNKKITCYPSFMDDVAGSYTFIDEAVVQDGKILTSQGPSTVFLFALKIVENLVGEEKAKTVSNGILLK